LLPPDAPNSISAEAPPRPRCGSLQRCPGSLAGPTSNGNGRKDGWEEKARRNERRGKEIRKGGEGSKGKGEERERKRGRVASWLLGGWTPLCWQNINGK